MLETLETFFLPAGIRNEAVREKWRPCVLEAIQFFPKEHLQTEVSVSGQFFFPFFFVEQLSLFLSVRTSFCPVLTIFDTQILQMALEKGEPNEPQDSRQLSCEMLGALAKRLDRYLVDVVATSAFILLLFLCSVVIEKLFLQKALSFCQDTDYTVRITMCNELDALARAIGCALVHLHIRCQRERNGMRLFHRLIPTKQHITKELFELLQDEEHGI